MLKYIVLTIFLCISFLNLTAQNTYNISGAIVDEKNNAADLAQISLLRISDSTFVKSAFSDRDGSFELTNVSPGQYILQVNLLSYEDYVQPLDLKLIDQDVVLDTIILRAATTNLDLVTVTAKVPYIERQIDRTVINVEANIENAGSNAIEILERAPGLAVENDGNIILKGRAGVTVFINDKPSYLSGTELDSYLRSLPSGSIQKIEIMTNPPAKYEAAGNSGVINIITKRNKLLGFQGNVSLSYGQGLYNNSNNNVNLNFNREKVGLYANVSAGFYTSFQDLIINRFYKNELNEPLSSFTQNSINLRGGQYLNGKIGTDFYPNDRTTFGVSFKNSISPEDRNVDNTSNVLDNQGGLLQRVEADNLTDGIFKNQLYNAYVSHKIDTLGSSISLDTDYVVYTSGRDQEFVNLIFNDQNQLTFREQINGDTPSDISIFAVKSDYVKPLQDGSKFEAGVKSAFTNTDNEAIYSTTIDGITEPNYNLSNRFLYEEWINAGYVNYKRAFGPVSVQAGLRGESTQLEGNQLGNVVQKDSSFAYTYNTVFPTFYASWKADTIGKNTLTFSYGRRIDRPYFQDLNPFIRPLDRFTIYGGNPNLQPTYSHNLSLSHSFSGILNTAINYSKTVDGINETLEIRDGIYYSRPGNIASDQALTFSLDANLEITKWYRVNSYVEFGHVRFDSQLYTEQLNSKGNYVYAQLSNTFTLKKDWSLSLSGRARTDRVLAQLLINQFYVMSFGAQKKILDGKGNLRFRLSDPFYFRRGGGVINNLRLTDADWFSRFDSRRASIAFSWRFGTSDFKKEKYNSSGSDSEQRRVRS